MKITLVLIAIVCGLPVLVLGQCPAIGSINPPSGHTATEYVIEGTNLNDVASVSPSPGASIDIVNSTHIDLSIQDTGTVTITLIPTDTDACEAVSDLVEVKLVSKLSRYNIYFKINSSLSSC